MNVALITGAAGLIGSEAVEYFAQKGFRVIGIDNNMRQYFFGEDGSVRWNAERLSRTVTDYTHLETDIRDFQALEKIFSEYGSDIKLIIHSAAQPSHDWAAKEPITDFTINANGTLNLLELTRQHCREAAFIFMSTNKVYGDLPNSLPLQELSMRWEIDPEHKYFKGIDENMSIDQSKHSLFGASKAAADLLVQEYGRYFGMNTVCFRGGCLTGPHHSGAELHGFLAYLMKCCVLSEKYTVFGYKAKQVRDNIHSYDLITAFDAFYQDPGIAKVYNMGGGRDRSCSVLEAIALCEEISGNTMSFDVSDDNRSGDHIWYISDLSAFEKDYPQWRQTYSLKETLQQMYELNVKRWKEASTT